MPPASFPNRAPPSLLTSRDADFARVKRAHWFLGQLGNASEQSCFPFHGGREGVEKHAEPTRLVPPHSSREAARIASENRLPRWRCL